MSTLPNYYNACVKTLQALHKQHPSFPIGRHISTALADYGDSWGLTDKEMYFALKRYQTLMEMDGGSKQQHEKYVEEVVNEGIHLESLFEQDEEGQDGDEENNW